MRHSITRAANDTECPAAAVACPWLGRLDQRAAGRAIHIDRPVRRADPASNFARNADNGNRSAEAR